MKSNKGVLKNKIDVKIFILFLLNQVRYPLPYGDVYDMVLEEGVIAEFDFAECFSELCDQGHVLAQPMEGVTYYLITDLGMRVAADLQDSLLESIRKHSLKSAMRYLSLHRRGAEAETEVKRREDGQFSVTCTVREAAGVYASYSLTVPTEAQANAIREHFRAAPEDVVRGLLSVATGEIEYLLGGK